MTMRRFRLTSADPVGDISKALQEATVKSKTEPPAPEPPAPETPPEGGGGSGMPGEPPSSGSAPPETSVPDIPTMPAMEPPPFPMGEEGASPMEAPAPQSTDQIVQNLGEAAEKLNILTEKLEELVEGGPSITTRAEAPSLKNIPLENEEVQTQTSDELGLKPFGQFSSNARRSSMQTVTKREVTSPAAKTQPITAEQLKPTDGPPMAVPGTEGMSKPVDGEKPFVEEPKQEKGNISMKENPGSVEVLFPTANQLRDSRRSRLGFDPEVPQPTSIPSAQPVVQQTTSDVTQAERDEIMTASEKKASDLAGMYLTRYQSAIELSHKAQERGIVACPLRDKLATRLAQAGVPDAELLAAEVVEGAATDNFREAHNQALEYLGMDDETFLRVAETVGKTPGTRTAISDRARVAHETRMSATQGSIPVQASGPLSPAEGLRERIRRTTPRPTGFPLSRSR